MRRAVVLAVYFVSVLACSAQTQKTVPDPVHVAAGTVLTFHLQTRLHPSSGNETDGLPEGTILRVKMLDSVDSSVDRDGTEFRGVLVSSVTSGDQVVVHPDAEIRGVLALLRSKNHPEGFRYELLITQMEDQGKSYSLTASLNPSFFDGPSHPVSATTSTSVPASTPKPGVK